ncbi:MAG: YbaB/EbfC family nucleoid-associated protein [Dongiaceae bacterium]
MKNIGAMLQQAQAMQQKMQALQDQLAKEEVVGNSGSGAVVVTLSGKGECKAVKIKPEAIDAADLSLLEDLLLTAFNDAKAKAEERLSAEMNKITGGLGGTGGMKLPF